MIELDRHIEILLLENDCVIVPDLGGFMAHYVEASYDSGESLYLPPLRTLGFNPKLKMNDSLLAQSYVESYDISYPEAVVRIEKEVSEIKQHIENQGFYDIYDIGTLKLNKEGNYEFEPCEAGILTPSLYGLSALDIHTIGEVATVAEPLKQETEPKQTEGKAIIMKMSTMRKVVAVAAAVVLLFLLAIPFGNETRSFIEMCKIDSELFYRIMPKEVTTNKPVAVAKQTNKPQQASAQKPQSASAPINTQHPSPNTQHPSPNTQPPSPNTQHPSPNTQHPSPITQPTWTIVLASQVAKKNAEIFVGQLKGKGYADTEIVQRAKGIKVVYGHFESESEAQNQLRKLRQQSSDFAEAWVMNLK